MCRFNDLVTKVSTNGVSSILSDKNITSVQACSVKVNAARKVGLPSKRNATIEEKKK